MTDPSPSPFAAPWEAQVFALVVSLREAGLFTWSEWAERLGQGIRPAEGPERAADYGAWLATLEGILAERGIAAPDVVMARTKAFLEAAQMTPHGQPIRLETIARHRS